jgi:hypothetical protein
MYKLDTSSHKLVGTGKYYIYKVNDNGQDLICTLQLNDYNSDEEAAQMGQLIVNSLNS